MTKELLSPFAVLCNVEFFARLSYGLARTPVLPLFALSLGASPEVIGFIVGASTITGIFFKLPAGALSDIVGRKTMLLSGLVVFALAPFAYVLVNDYIQLIGIRFIPGLATAIYGSAMGTFGTLYDIGHASGPILAGVLIASMNFINAFAIIGSILIVAAFFFTFTVKENVTV